MLWEGKLLEYDNENVQINVWYVKQKVVAVVHTIIVESFVTETCAFMSIRRRSRPRTYHKQVRMWLVVS